MAKLVIIRGNSGCGKTTLSKALQSHYGRGTLVVAQDTVRRDMLQERMVFNNLSVGLCEQIIRFGYEQDLLVIVEGFYETEVYGDMLINVKKLFGQQVLAYYYDISFEETVKRHQTRDKSQDFTADDMKRWWRDKDILNWPEEQILGSATLEKTKEKIINDIDVLNI